MTTPNDEIDDKAIEDILEDTEIDDYHFIVKYGRKREDTEILGE